MESRGIRIDVDVFTSRCGRDGSLVKRDLVTGRLTRFERIRQESGLIEGKVTTAKSLHLLPSLLENPSLMQYWRDSRQARRKANRERRTNRSMC